MLVRNFSPDDADALRAVFLSSVHGLARGFYTPEQLDAWAPEAHDRASWRRRLAANRPFVAVLDGRVAGFADLQDTGCIDQFFVAAGFARRGVGAALMQRILDAAADRRLDAVFSDVSLAAEAFFARYGFRVTERRLVTVSGVQLANARMVKALADGSLKGASGNLVANPGMSS